MLRFCLACLLCAWPRQLGTGAHPNPNPIPNWPLLSFGRARPPTWSGARVSQVGATGRHKTNKRAPTLQVNQEQVFSTCATNFWPPGRAKVGARIKPASRQPGRQARPGQQLGGDDANQIMMDWVFHFCSWTRPNGSLSRRRQTSGPSSLVGRAPAPQLASAKTIAPSPIRLLIQS